jgi:cytochrome P450
VRGIKETPNSSQRIALRLYPVFGRLGRQALQDTILPCGGGPLGTDPIFVPQGSSVTADMFPLHRDELVFGDDPEAFRPERWNIIKPSRWEYLPFGGGMRQCVGKDKALAEASYVLILLASRFLKITSMDDREWTPNAKLTVRNTNGCLVSLMAS